MILYTNPKHNQYSIEDSEQLPNRCSFAQQERDTFRRSLGEKDSEEQNSTEQNGPLGLKGWF
jgi:hypothetical protein